MTPPRRPRSSTVSRRGRRGARPKLARPPQRPRVLKPTLHSASDRLLPPRQIGRFVDDDKPTLIDVLDHLLQKGVVLNAEVVLALANVDLIYLRLSAILCGTARTMQRASR